MQQTVLPLKLVQQITPNEINKMKTTFRKSMIWLHTYIGLLSGWLLFAVFLTGTLSYYNQEITHWLTNGKQSPHTQQVLLDNALHKLHNAAPNTKRWQISLPDKRGSSYRISYREDDKRISRYLDPVTLAFTDRQQIEGGNFFRTFHYTLSLRQYGGRYLTGIAGMAMLIAVFSGIYTHRRFFKDFFTIRRQEPKKFTIDLHAILGVITIPFCFVLCASAMLIYISMYQPFAISHYFDSYRTLDQQVSTEHKPLKAIQQTADKAMEISTYQSQLNNAFGDNHQITRLTVNNPLDTKAQLIFTKAKHEWLSNKPETIVLSRQGELLPEIEAERTARMVRRIFYGLHEAHFASPALRAVLFILGMMATVLIATGMIIWLQKRQNKQVTASYVMVEKTNNGIFYGLSLAVGLYFLASKLPFMPIWAENINPSAPPLTTEAFFGAWLFALVLCWLLNVKQGKQCLLVLNFMTFLSLLLSVFGVNETNNALSTAGHVTLNDSFDLAKVTINLWLLATCVYFYTVLKRQVPRNISSKNTKSRNTRLRKNDAIGANKDNSQLDVSTQADRATEQGGKA